MTSTTVREALWRCPNVPGLQILTGSGVEETASGAVSAICSALLELAGCVIIDLPATLSPANRAAIEASDLVALVINREPLCLTLARRMIERIRSWNSGPEVGVVVVNPTALSSSVPISTIEKDLGAQVLGAMPPAADVCVQGQLQHVPGVLLDTEGSLAGAVLDLSRKMLAETAPSTFLKEAGRAPERTQSLR